jgi:hypothetical protein
VWQDFLYGDGTAMSPGLPWLAAQGVLTFLASQKGFWGTLGVVGLTLFGLLSGVLSLSEPIVRRICSRATFRPLKAGIIVVPSVMMVFGILDLLRRRRERSAHSAS